MEDKPISKMEFIAALKAAGVRERSESWNDYERGKVIVRAASNGDWRLYDIYLKWLVAWVGV